MIYSKQYKRFFFVIGVARRFGLGLVIDKYGVNIDLGPFWVSVEV